MAAAPVLNFSEALPRPASLATVQRQPLSPLFPKSKQRRSDCQISTRIVKFSLLGTGAKGTERTITGFQTHRPLASFKPGRGNEERRATSAMERSRVELPPALHVKLSKPTLLASGPGFRIPSGWLLGALCFFLLSLVSLLVLGVCGRCFEECFLPVISPTCG